MRKVVIVLACLFLSLNNSVAQEVSKQYTRALGAKILFIDYGNPNGIDDLGITNGFDLSYIHGINEFLNIAVPLKLGVINVSDDINNRMLFSIDGILQFVYEREGKKLAPYVFGGAGIVKESSAESNFQIPMGVGFNYKLGGSSYLNLQLEYRLSQTENRNNAQLGVGYIYSLVKLDRDKDGILDKEDRCPDIPGPASSNGCPDTDNDGIIDLEDACPDVVGPKYAKGCPDADMDRIPDAEDDCPEVAGIADFNGCPDSDRDGIKDSEDACPEAPGTAATNGCPDTDGDGVADKNDDCPEVAGLKALNGCPDTDGDGISDKDDQCPELAGTINGCPDTDGDGVIDPDDRCPKVAGLASNKGCPEIEEEVKKVLEFAMRAVQFNSGKATLKPESLPALDQIVQILKDYPGHRLSIAGHTDGQGADDLNLILSEQRAKACYQYIVSKGISPNRMGFAGYGETVPIADNNTIQGRQLNRRVEFNLFIE